MQIFAILIFVGLLVFTIVQGKQLVLIIRERIKSKKAAKEKEVATPVEQETKSNNEKEC